jgi:hypothetical protein
MKRTIFSILATMFVLLGAQLPAVADVGISVEFSDEEVRIIGAWYEEHDSRAGHGGGKSKHKGLPPGIAKNLARGKPLPPGIAKQRLPDGLVDGKVLLVEIATQVIHDILTDIVLR